MQPPKRRSTTDEWIKKTSHTHILEYYSAMRKKEILPFVTTWVNLEGIMLSEISQTGQIPHDITYIWNF